MSEQVFNLLILVRIIISMCFTVLNIFVMTEYRFSKKISYIFIVGLFCICLLVNIYVFYTYGFFVLTRIFLLTMTFPYVVLLLGNIFKSQFNFWVQISVFYVVYVIANYLIYRFYIGIVTDILIPVLLLVLFIYVKYIRKPYREFVNLIHKGWSVISLIPVLFTTIFLLLCNFPTNIAERPENYPTCIVTIVLMFFVYAVIYHTFKTTYDLMMKVQIEKNMRLQIVLQK